MSAPDPGIERAALADFDACGLWANGDHFSGDLVAKGVGKRQPQRQLRVAAHADITLMNMNVGGGRPRSAPPAREPPCRSEPASASQGAATVFRILRLLHST